MQKLVGGRSFAAKTAKPKFNLYKREGVSPRAQQFSPQFVSANASLIWIVALKLLYMAMTMLEAECHG